MSKERETEKGEIKDEEKERESPQWITQIT